MHETNRTVSIMLPLLSTMTPALMVPGTVLGFTWVKPTVRKRNGTYHDGGPIGDGLGLNKHRRAC